MRSVGKQAKAQSYKVDRSVLQRILAYNIGYALLEKATAITLGATFSNLSTRNAKKARGMVIDEIPAWRNEQILASLWTNLGPRYGVDDIDLATRKLGAGFSDIVFKLIEGKQTSIERWQVNSGTAIYDAKTVIAYLGPLYKDKFSGILRTVSDWAREAFSRGFESLPCEEFTNTVLVSWPSLMRDKGLLSATRPTEWPSEVLDDLEDLTRRAEKWEARIKEEEEYEKSQEQAAWNDRYERVTEDEKKNIFLRVGFDPAEGPDKSIASQFVDNEFADAMSSMLPGTKVSIPKGFPKGYEPPPLPDNGSLTWPKVLEAMSGVGSYNAFGAITKARVVGSGFGSLPPRQADEVLRLQQERMNAQMNLQAELIDEQLWKSGVTRPPDRFPSTPRAILPERGVALKIAEPEPISPFDSKPRQFSFEEE